MDKPQVDHAASPALLPVTVILPVRREPAQVADVLPLLGTFERVIVVESTDDPVTRELASRHGADFRVFSWAGGYPKKRTWAARKCDVTTPWILFLDADERPTTGFIEELRRTLPQTDAAGFWLTYDMVFLGRRLRFGIPQRKLALMRTGAGAYEPIDDPGWTDLDMEVHEHLVVDGAVGVIRAPLVHLDCKTIDAYVRRHNTYATWEARRHAALSNKPERWRELTLRQRVKYRLVGSPVFPPLYFVLQYFLRLGFLDGGVGARFALLKAGYFAQVGAKIAEERMHPPAARPPVTTGIGAPR
ncbi:MAG: glycosyltransferase family 2 protein [Planctomycetia bacterium]|nr:glycosyltransferase family 2 protein [Planctomycetia bacterium]